jgi:hypothetical protein
MGMTIDPLMHISSSPGPEERMCKQPVVFRPSGMKMLNHLLFTRPYSTIKIMSGKTPQQQLGLIEP